MGSPKTDSEEWIYQPQTGGSYLTSQTVTTCLTSRNKQSSHLWREEYLIGLEKISAQRTGLCFLMAVIPEGRKMASCDRIPMLTIYLINSKLLNSVCLINYQWVIHSAPGQRTALGGTGRLGDTPQPDLSSEGPSSHLVYKPTACSSLPRSQSCRGPWAVHCELDSVCALQSPPCLWLLCQCIKQGLRRLEDMANLLEFSQQMFLPLFPPPPPRRIVNANCSFEQFPSILEGPLSSCCQMCPAPQPTAQDGSKGRESSLHTSN